MLAHPVAQNTLSLYAVQFANMFLPLLLIPYLARVLLPESFGLYLFFYSLSIWIYAFIEYGFNLSATREISRERDNKQHVAEIATNVIGGQVILAIGVIFFALCAYRSLSFLRQNPNFLILSLMFGISRGCGPLWYFQGKEKMRMVAGLEVVGRLCATLLTFLLVYSPSQSRLALAISAFASIVVTTIQMGLMYREAKFKFPRVNGAVCILRQNISIFVYRIAGSLYTTANIIIVGLLSSPVVVGFYGGAEKIIRGLLTLISPVINALYPRINYLMLNEPAKAWRIIRLTLSVFVVGGVFVAGAVAVYAQTWVRLLLGPGYEAAIPILQILSIEACVLPLSTVIAVLYMLPLKMEKQLNAIVISAGLLNATMAIVFVGFWQGVGMAITAVTTETLVALVSVLVLFRCGMPLGPREGYDSSL